MKLIKAFLGILAACAIATAAHSQSTSGAIEQLPVRTLTHVLGHDSSGLVGREPVTDFVKPGSTSIPVGNIATFGNVSGSSIVDSGKAVPSGDIVGTSDTQTLTNKTLTSPSITGPTISSPSFTGTITVGGVTQTFPTSGLLVGTTDTQTLTNKSISADQINSGTLPASRLSGAYPSVTQIGDALFGNAGSNPYIAGNGNVPLSLQANGTEFLRGFDSGSGKMRVWGKYTTDSNATTWLNLGQFVIASEGSSNAIVGFVSNILAPGTTAFPTAVTGIAYNKANGNTAFPLYAEAHAVAQGVVTSELDTFNDTGVAAPTTYPWSRAIGTSSVIPVALTLAADHCTTCTTAPSAAAIEIGPGGVSGDSFQFGTVINKAAVKQYSYFQDSDATTGPANGIYVAIPGSGNNLILRTMGTMAAGNAVFTVQNSSAVSTASIRQNGQAFFGNSATSGSALTLTNSAGACTLTPTSTTASFACSSDERLKKNIVDARSASNWIQSFRVREYDLKSTGDHLVGVIAQEIQKDHPEMVHTDDKGMLSVDGPNPWMTIKAIQELQAQNEDLRLELRIVEIAGLLSLVAAALFSRIRSRPSDKPAHAI
ncbi:tail fiber domain-containing protein [Rhizobium sp. RCAM05973]|uniref:tail fiber domain-containing protein n=1 Tax=Rhizobium sp. RCAM05973 TaxID=2994066 RepID=UPI0022EBCBFF|nr:tail fiber domain-containing protein [Rhizobium sp. RCAM05973]